MGSHTLFSLFHFDCHEYRRCLSCLTIDLKAKTPQNFGNEHSTVCVSKTLFTFGDYIKVQVSVYFE